MHSPTLELYFNLTLFVCVIDRHTLLLHRCCHAAWCADRHVMMSFREVVGHLLFSTVSFSHLGMFTLVTINCVS